MSGLSACPRVLLVHDSHLFGGMEIAMLRAMEHLRGDVDFTLLVRALPDSTHTSPLRLLTDADTLGVPVLRPWTPTRGPMPLRRLIGMVDVLRIIRRCRPDIVHIHSNLVEGARVHTLLAWVARVPVVVRTEHISPGAFSQPPFGGRAQRFFDRLTTLTITVSEADRREQIEVVGRSADAVICVRNGVDTDRFRPADRVNSEAVPLVVGAIGRLVDAKRHVDLIDAMAVVSAKRPDARAVVVGGGELEPELRRRIAGTSLRCSGPSISV